MVDIDKVSDELTWHFEYDDGDVDTYGKAVGGKEMAKEKAILTLGAVTDDVDPDCLTLTRADRVGPDDPYADE